jgi:prepilin-type N-terminal cleavage/methylation domain-containing protein
MRKASLGVISRGFTLIEIVVVIVLLGALAAIAIPKFADNTQQAEIAFVKNVAGTLRSATKIAQSKWLTSDKQRTNLALQGENINSNFINMVDYSQFGCPVQHWRINSETNPSANNATDCRTVFSFLLNRCPTNATDCGGVPDPDFEPAYLGSGICEYRLRSNTNYRITYFSSSPDCAVTTSGF